MDRKIFQRIIREYGKILIIAVATIGCSFFIFKYIIGDIVEKQQTGDSLSTMPEEQPVKHQIAGEFVSPYQEVRHTISQEQLSQEEKNSALYQVEYVTTWSQDTHPGWYPWGAHTSPLIVWAHVTPDNQLYTNRETASRAVEAMAETGAANGIETILKQMQSTRSISDFRIGKKTDAPGASNVFLKVEAGTPYVTAISMIAPSPDWFVAVESIQLYNNGEWVRHREVPLKLYDAGTDSGTVFTAGNWNTPSGSYRIITEKKEVGTPIGFIRFTLFGSNGD